MNPYSILFDLDELKRQKDEIRQKAVRHLWHRNTQVALYADVGPLTLVEGNGVMVRDISGREYIDTSSRLVSTAVGFGRSEIAEAMAAQARQLHFCETAEGNSNVPAALLASKIAEIAPGDLDVTFFTNSGAEANEAALKMAFAYHKRMGFTKRTKIISRSWSYHGATLGILSANGIIWEREQYEPLLPGFSRITQPYCYRCELGMTYPDCGVQCAKMLEWELQSQGPDSVAAFIAEPISVPQAIKVPPPEYWPMIRDICNRYGVLLILDEVICGFGRTGRLFASEHWNLIPDIMTCAKGITSGYAPLGGAVASRKIADVFWGKEEDQFNHFCTYSGHPVSCAAALVNINIIEREQLVKNSDEMGAYLREGLREFEGWPLVGHINGLGLLTSIELVQDRKSKTSITTEMSDYFVKQLADLGVHMRMVGGPTVYINPPLIINKEQVEKIVSSIGKALENTAARFHINQD